MNIKIGILGYGNIGRGVETALRDNPDMELAAVFTRRDPSQVKILTENVPVISVSEIEAWKDKIDVLLLCGGSATDLPQQTPSYAKMFNVVDTFDTHAKVPAHFAAVDRSAKENGKIARVFKGAFKVEGALISSINRNAEWALNTLARLERTTERRPSVLEAMREQAAKTEPAKKQPASSHDKESR